MNSRIEVGLLSFEDWSEKGVGFIYEIFVPKQFRRQGVGTFLLFHAEKCAVQLNCTTLRLKPHALDVEPGLENIRLWYFKNGYYQSSSDIDHLEKALKKSFC